MTRLHLPACVAQAGTLLRALPNACLVSGGQSAAVAANSAAQAMDFVSLARIPELRRVAVEGGVLEIGAACTHREVAQSADVRRSLPALSALAGGIGDTLTRNRATAGGALFTAARGGCYPAALLGTEATIVTTDREIPAEAFFSAVDGAGALALGEIVVALRLPLPSRATYQCFRPIPGRFALVGVFASVGQQGVRVGVTGLRVRAIRAGGAERYLALCLAGAGRPPMASTKALFGGPGQDTTSGSAEYKAAIARVLLERAGKALSDDSAADRRECSPDFS